MSFDMRENEEVSQFIKEVIFDKEVPRPLKEDGLEILLKYAGTTIQITPTISVLQPVYIEIQKLLIDEKKIRAIKLLREATGIMLIEAKNAVDGVQRDMLQRGQISHL